MASTTSGKVITVNSQVELDKLLAQSQTSVAFFWASFHEGSQSGGPVDIVVSQLAATNPNIIFFKVETEALPEVAEEYGVSVVPTFIFFQGATLLERLEGVSTAALAQAVERHGRAGHSASHKGASGVSTTGQTSAPASEDEAVSPVEAKLKKLIRSCPVLLFMKGTPTAPRCGFSKAIIDILVEENIKFKSFDILKDEKVRQTLKQMSNWPTYPQLYVNGELVGGLDILREMQGEGNLKGQLGLPESDTPGNASTSSVAEGPDGAPDFKALIESAKVMLFMKGQPEEPRCGFSKQVVHLLREEKIEFGYFDILSDERVRQGLKEYSNWPTYPQLYVNGELIGGLDILRELSADSPLKEALNL